MRGYALLDCANQSEQDDISVMIGRGRLVDKGQGGDPARRRAGAGEDARARGAAVYRGRGAVLAAMK